jgi:hypothetical protein
MKMSKLLRSELKEIVKECLVEILSEGIGTSNTMTESHNSLRSFKPSRNKKRKSHLDNIVYKQKIEEKKKNIKEHVLSSNITSDPILNELLADTAVSTLQEQHAAEGKRGSGPSVAAAGDNAAKIVDRSDPSDLFGDSANKWAELAFSK